MTKTKYIHIFMLFMLTHQISWANQCGSCCSGNQDTGKNIKEWFKKLGELSTAVGNSCLNLPQADQVRKLETSLANLRDKCNSTEVNLQQLKSKTDAKISALEKQLQSLSAKLSDCLPSVSSKKIRHGLLERKGSKCELKCNDGAYAYPTKSFSCRSCDFWSQETPKCMVAKSCKDVLKYAPNPRSGVYKVSSVDGTQAYDVYCDMLTDGGGWSLAAVIANGDNENWVYGDVDKDFGDMTSLWENKVLLGKVDKDTPTTGKDFKSRVFVEMEANELLISLKGKRYIQTEKSCLGGKSLKGLFNILRFSCAGSSYNCMFGKCLGKGGASTSSLCTHQCSIGHFYPIAGSAGEPLSNGRRPNAVLIKTGEANGAQDGNKDRVYISTTPYRNNVDYVPGLGTFTSLSGKIHTADVGIHHDVSGRSADKSLFYNLYVR